MKNNYIQRVIWNFGLLEILLGTFVVFIIPSDTAAQERISEEQCFRQLKGTIEKMGARLDKKTYGRALRQCNRGDIKTAIKVIKSRLPAKPTSKPKNRLKYPPRTRRPIPRVVNKTSGHKQPTRTSSKGTRSNPKSKPKALLKSKPKALPKPQQSWSPLSGRPMRDDEYCAKCD